MKLEKIKKLKPEKFQRRFGVKKETYNLLVEIVKKAQNNQKGVNRRLVQRGAINSLVLFKMPFLRLE